MSADEEVLVDEQTTEDDLKLNLNVEIDEIGPCKKHISVTISREDIDTLYDRSVEGLVGEAEVPGFRVGKVPTQLIRKRFREEIMTQLKQKLLLQSMEQVSEDHGLEPIGEPDLEVENLEIPDEGDFEYEFEIEVRPTFDIPDFSTMKIERAVAEVTEDDVEEQQSKFLAQYATYVPYGGPAKVGDSLVVDLKFSEKDSDYRSMEEVTIELQPVLRFHDAEVEGFDKLMEKAKVGDVRKTDVTISSESSNIEMRGEKLALEITVQDMKKVELPELDSDFFERLGVESEGDLKDKIRESLERQNDHSQRESVREQLLTKITDTATWDLPEDLVVRQADNALRREILEMQQAGYTPQQLQARESQIRQQSLTNTEESLKQHFILDKVAEDEGIEVDPVRIDTEIQMMAWQSGENPRKVRARLVKSGMVENLEAQIREQMTVDHILEKVEFVDVPSKDTKAPQVTTIDQAICKSVIPTTSASEEEDES